jgi:DNA adenine methylase
VQAPQLREPGVTRQLPHLGDDGRGVQHAKLREPGVSWLATPGVSPEDYHPMTMPRLRTWFAALSARLRHVRIVNGDWTRVLTPAVVETLPVRLGDGVAGVFLDPPYADTAGRNGLYTHDSFTVAHTVREWALAHGDRRNYRIVMAGFAGEHGEAFTQAGWREVEWFRAGFLRGGMKQLAAGGHQQHRERLWCSPHCLAPVAAVRPPLLAWLDEDEAAAEEAATGA